MERQDAERTILEVERVRRDTRHALNPVWFGNLAFGLFFAGTVILGIAGAGADVTSLYWLLAGALTIGVVVRHYARHERELGAQSPVLDGSTAVLLAMFAGILAANLLTDGLASAVVPLYVAALGIVVLGLVLRDTIEVAAGVNAALWATVVARRRSRRARALEQPRDRGHPHLRRDRRPEMGVTHPAQRLDDTVHQRVRLGILAVLSEASRADFGFLRDTLDLTDGNLSRHIAVLEQAGLVAVEKGFEGKRTRTWVQATKAGRAALHDELAALRELLARVDG